MRIAIIGPNLWDQSKGLFHVHSAECRDGLNGRKYPLEYRMEVEVDAPREAVEFIYSDHAGDHGYEPGMPEYDAFIAENVGDFHFHNCCR